MNWDTGTVSYSRQLPIDDREGDPVSYQKRFREFIRNFRIDHICPYKDQLERHYNLGRHYLEVNIEHLKNYDGQLFDFLESNPQANLDLFETAIPMALTTPPTTLLKFHLILKSNDAPTSIRNINSGTISKLITIRGIVVGASRVRSKATSLRIICRTCNDVRDIPVRYGFGGAQLPRLCIGNTAGTNPGAARCPLDPYMIDTTQCTYVDHQTLKLQELPEEVPAGEMPRHMLCTVDRSLCEQVVPGSRVTVHGVFSTFESRGARSSRDAGGVALRTAYVRAIGLSVETSGHGRSAIAFTEEEEEEFRQLARSKDIHKTILQSIEPAIFGHDDIKSAISCLLFGGSPKKLPDGMRIRGDINVLLLGDPGTAKSQFLKFVEKVAPVAVYTSGKGSSAAGLTASVIRDPATSEFYLEGGAMVLADGGVVCIDEFDKMRPQDRVAIHEAMEQQTISIAKAGITTVLNSRSAVLAAANPIFGSFDDLRTTADNIDFQTTILSRFDLIFAIRDVRDRDRDKRIATHVIGLHQTGGDTERPEGELPISVLRRYIAYCRSRCSPRLSERCSESLASHYVRIRADQKRAESNPGAGERAIPITVRQLEACVRLTESLAKMELQPEALQSHVEEAMRLFRVSTLEASTTGTYDNVGAMAHQNQQDIARMEEVIKDRLPIGLSIPERKLIDELCRTHQGTSEALLRHAIAIMVRRDDLEYRQMRRVIYRKR